LFILQKYLPLNAHISLRITATASKLVSHFTGTDLSGEGVGRTGVKGARVISGIEIVVRLSSFSGIVPGLKNYNF